MGFKCPVCHKDFGTNKHALLKHITEENGTVPDIRGLVYINSVDSMKKVLSTANEIFAERKQQAGGKKC